MANNRCTYQQQYNVSVPKNDLLEWVAYNKQLSKKDYRVFLLLITELDGYKPPKRNEQYVDPNNYKAIDEYQISDRLEMKVKDVEKSLKTLERYGIIETGESTGVSEGYRFTF